MDRDLIGEPVYVGEMLVGEAVSMSVEYTMSEGQRVSIEAFTPASGLRERPMPSKKDFRSTAEDPRTWLNEELAGSVLEPF